MIIDCHCHAGKGDGLTGPWDTAAPLDKYLRRAARAGDRPHRALRRVSFGLRASPTARSRASSRSRPRPLLRLRLRPCRHATAGRCARWCSEAVEQYGFRRHQGAPPRRADHARDLRGRARLRAAGSLRRRSARSRSSSCSRPSIRTSPSSFRTWAASPTTGARSSPDRPSGAPPERLHRYVGRPPLRSAGAGGAAGRRAQDPVRLRRAVAASRRRAGEVRAARPVAGGRSSWCSAATFCG